MHGRSKGVFVPLQRVGTYVLEVAALLGEALRKLKDSDGKRQSPYSAKGGFSVKD
jgi:hypothetical protein